MRASRPSRLKSGDLTREPTLITVVKATVI
jgi:hypothetical protein